MKDLLPHEDPDFLGIEVLQQKFDKWVMRHQLLITLHICTPCKTLPSNYRCRNANLVCYKLLFHKSITTTIMTLSKLAYHDVLKHALRCYLLLFSAFLYYFAYIILPSNHTYFLLCGGRIHLDGEKV